jgi:uncharacterized protein with GYD domain
MATYVLMTKLAPEITKDMRDREQIGRSWKQAIENKCPQVKFLSHYALLGPYDFMDIYEAPDEEEAAKVSMITLANGALKAESWTAIPYQRFVELSKEI